MKQVVELEYREKVFLSGFFGNFGTQDSNARNKSRQPFNANNSTIRNFTMPSPIEMEKSVVLVNYECDYREEFFFQNNFYRISGQPGF